MSVHAQRAKEVRDSVLQILEQYPETRDDDRQLMLRYWSTVDHIHFDFTFPQSFVERATSPESITRARRLIQASGLFTATEEAVIRRRKRETELRDHYATT
jgi:hypothetical protein